MTDTFLSNCPAAPVPDGPGEGTGCEPALSAIRALPSEALDRLAARWLLGLGLRPHGRAEGRRVPPTYVAEAAADPGCRVLARVLLRRNALQAHHVDTFLGALSRSRVATGILATAGPVAPEAIRLAQALRRPRIRLVSGAAWVLELAEARAGVVRGSQDAWLLDPSCLLDPEAHAAASGPSRRNGQRW